MNPDTIKRLTNAAFAAAYTALGEPGITVEEATAALRGTADRLTRLAEISENRLAEGAGA